MNSSSSSDRNNGHYEHIARIGELVEGYVLRFEREDIVIDLGGVEAILPRSQQSRIERWKQGERIRTVIHNVLQGPGPRIEVSRTSVELLRRLFESEVPEIRAGKVVIKAAAREPGEHAKIAVTANDHEVDAVRACAGLNRTRVLAIICELRGEKIDVIEWSDEPSVFAANALTPAKVIKVRITDIERRLIEVTGDKAQISLALGRLGHNLRLASRLVGWTIVVGEEDPEREVIN